MAGLDGLLHPPPDAKRTRQVKRLAWSGTYGAGGVPHGHQLELPEQCRILSASHEGCDFRHRRWWVPQTCRIQPPPKKKEPIPGERELLYLALYRDKVEEAVRQQEALARGASPGASTARPPPSAGLGGPAAAAAAVAPGGEVPRAADDAHRAEDGTDFVPALAPGTPGLRATTAGSCLTAPAAVSAAAEPPGSSLGAEAEVGFGAASSVGPVPSLRPVPARPPVRPPHGGAPAAVHVASVQVKGGFGGVVSEHLEAKRLGKLFDEWRAKQEEQGLDSSLPSAAPSKSYVGRGRSGSSGVGAPVTTLTTLSSYSQRSSAPFKAAGALVLDGGETPTPRAPSTQEHFASSDLHPDGFDPDVEHSFDVLGDAFSVGGGSSLLGRAAVPEKSKAERLFGVMTNPKTRVANFADGHGNDREASLPTSIEGFPVLHLAKLYAGPWRLD